jgi:response regulator RpfG family c-di-GMP phosphodiesterase
MALKLLIIDPNSDWLLEAQKYFIEQMYEVTTASNGKDAQLALYQDKFFSIVINYEIQNTSFYEVLKYIKSNHTNQRIIAIFNDKDLIDSKIVNQESLWKFGVLETLSRPFELSTLKSSLEGHQSLKELIASITKREGVSEETEVNKDDKEFSKIKIDEFYSTQAVFFDIYIKLSSSHYLKILHTGDTFSQDRINKYKNEKKIKYLYFHKDDTRKFIEYYQYLSKKLIANEKISSATKVEMIKNVSEIYIEELYVAGLRPQVIDQGKRVCEAMYSLIEKDKGLFKVFRSLQDLDPTAYSHAFLVTLYASAITKQFDWQTKWTIETIAMGSMFHDIGKTMLPKDFAVLRVADMSPEQYEEYKKHPELGLKLVEGNRLISNSVKEIIMQHHEFFDGKGFPHGKKGKKILVLANIVCLANDFVDLMLEHKIQPTDTLKMILMNKEMTARYSSALLEKFIQIFVDSSKIIEDTKLPSNSKLVNSKKAA